MATQGRASIVDTALESSHLKHWKCIYPSIYICARNCANEKKRREKEKHKYYTYYHTYNQSGTLGTRQEGENVRGLAETPLFVHIYTGGCQIYSQSAISETPSLTYYLLYMRIQRHCIHSCEVLSTPHSHLYSHFLHTNYFYSCLYIRCLPTFRMGHVFLGFLPMNSSILPSSSILHTKVQSD